MTFERFTVVRVPFPFTDREATKNRPALVLSDPEAFNTAAGHSVMAMITSAANPSWPLDCPITDLGAAGLPAPSKVLRIIYAVLANNTPYQDRSVLKSSMRFGQFDSLVDSRTPVRDREYWLAI